MTTLTKLETRDLQQERIALAKTFNANVQLWEKNAVWVCDESNEFASHELAHWFDALVESEGCVQTAVIDSELWVASTLHEDGVNSHQLLAGIVSPDPVRLAAQLATQCTQQAAQAKIEAEQQDLINSYASHMIASFEELHFLRQVSKHIEYCDATRTLRDVATAMLPDLRRLIASQAMLFIPAVESKSEAQLECVPSEGNVPWHASEQKHLFTWIRAERSATPLIWNGENGLNAVRWPELPHSVQSLLLIPIVKEGSTFGWLLAVNKVCESVPDPRFQLGTDEFGTVEASLLQSAATLLSSHALNVRLFHEQEKLIVDIIHTLVSVLEAKDIYTCGHSNRVAMVARRLAEEMQLSARECEEIYLSGLLHDVGKVGIADDILLKPDKLTPAEFAEIKLHPERGYRILQGMKPFANLLPGVLHHHEAYNGKGYPHQLSGEAIPLMARVIAVADTYDALTSNRPYRQGMSLEQTESIMQAGRGEQWDQRVIDAYFAARQDIREMCEQWRNEVMFLPASPGTIADNTLQSSEGNRVQRAVETWRQRS